MPTLNGKQLILIEDLIGNNQKIHPVQEAMVKFHGSQCGFCTPGFTMSLFSMYKNNRSVNKDIVDEALSGNLCRCTGYRPIIDAAKSLNNKIDLVKTESIADLVNSETEKQRSLAVKNLSGELSSFTKEINTKEAEKILADFNKPDVDTEKSKITSSIKNKSKSKKISKK